MYKRDATMKKLSLIFIFALTGCAIIYGNRSFLYKSADDYRNMTVADVDKIVSNGGDLSAVNSSGYRPISMACKSGANVDVIKQMIQNGANSYDCSLYDFFIYTTKNPYDRSVILKNVEDLINAGVEPTVLAEETILESMFFNPETVISLFKKYDVYPSQTYIKKLIINSPANYKRYLNLYKKQINERLVIEWILSSPYQKSLRGLSEWYEIVDKAKKYKIRNGVIGMTKEEYIMGHGIPDQEYKINKNTTVLTYIKELRKNVPLSARSYSTSSYFDLTDTVYTHGSTYTSGGYTNVNRWKENVYIDKGIITGIENQDQVITY